jgi:hypothetical protein
MMECLLAHHTGRKAFSGMPLRGPHERWSSDAGLHRFLISVAFESSRFT